jgi:hypothetical protein
MPTTASTLTGGQNVQFSTNAEEDSHALANTDNAVVTADEAGMAGEAVVAAVVAAVGRSRTIPSITMLTHELSSRRSDGLGRGASSWRFESSNRRDCRPSGLDPGESECANIVIE